MHSKPLFINIIYNTIIKQYYPSKTERAIVYSLERLQNYNERYDILKVIKQLFWIFLFSLSGEVISAFISSFIAIPGSVIGMLLLFFALHFKWIRMEQVDEVGSWLTNNMGIFFVPAGVGLISNFGVLANTWWQLLIIMVVTTVLMMAFVGKVVQSVKRHSEKKVVSKKGANQHVR